MDVMGAMDVGAEEVTGAFDGRNVCAVTEGERTAAEGLRETTGWGVAVSGLAIQIFNCLFKLIRACGQEAGSKKLTESRVNVCS